MELKRLVKGSCEGFDLEGNHLPQIPPLLPATAACVSKMLIFLAVSLGIRDRRVVRGELPCSPLQTQPGEPSQDLLSSVTCPLYFQCYEGAGDLGPLNTLIMYETPPRHLLNQLLTTSPQLCLFFLQPLFQPRVCIKEEFGRNTTLMTSFPFKFHGGRVWSKMSTRLRAQNPKVWVLLTPLGTSLTQDCFLICKIKGLIKLTPSSTIQ